MATFGEFMETLMLEEEVGILNLENDEIFSGNLIKLENCAIWVSIRGEKMLFEKQEHPNGFSLIDIGYLNKENNLMAFPSVSRAEFFILSKKILKM